MIVIKKDCKEGVTKSNLIPVIISHGAINTWQYSLLFTKYLQMFVFLPQLNFLFLSDTVFQVNAFSFSH
jgi:hypothetical protein